MEWNVFYVNPNSRELEKYNVLVGCEDFIKKLRRKFPDRDDFARELRSEMMYHYWSKAEWEVVISPWVGTSGKEWKVDVFWQLELNWDRFVDYCWSYGRRQRKQRGEEDGQ